MSKNFIALTAVCFFLAFPWVATRELHTRGEAREALVSQAMIQSGDWILPRTYNGGVPSKPPFSHWLAAVTALATGSVDEFTTRCANALAFLIVTLTWYRFVSRRADESCAFGSCLLLLLSFEWMRAAVSCRVDIMLAALLTGAGMMLFQFYERALRGMPLGAIALLSAAMLTKGPIGLALPLVIFALFLALRGMPYMRILRVCVLIGAPAALCAAIWYMLAIYDGGDQFLNKVWYENIQRLAGTQEDEPHKHSVFYLYLVFVLGLCPGIFGALRRLPQISLSKWRAIRSAFGAANALTQFAMISAAVFLLFFSIPASKRSVYLLPAFPPACFLLARWYSDREWRALETIGVRCTGVLLAAFPLLVASMKHLNLPAEIMLIVGRMLSLDRFSGVVFLILYLFTAGAWLRAVIARRRGNFVAARPAIFAAVFAFFTLLQGPVMDSFGAVIGERRFAEMIRPFVAADLALYSFGSEFYGTSFYLPHSIYSLPDEPPAGALVVLAGHDLPRLTALSAKSGAQIQVLAQTTSGVLRLGRPAVLVRVTRG